MRKLMILTIPIILLFSCASIVSTSNYPVNINSTPNNAEVTILDKNGDEIQNGETPMKVELKSSAGFFQSQSYTIKLKKEGYKERTVTLNSTIDGWYFANILFGGLPGMLIIDPATGAMWKLPEKLSTNLNKINQTYDGSDDNTFQVVLYNDLPKKVRQTLVKIK